MNYKPFILKVSAKFCGSSLFWGNDEELSIALIAFNEAIDNFDRSQGSSFLSYAYLVINRRLTDYMRKEGKNRHRFILASNTSAGFCLKSEGEVRRYSRAISVEKIRSKITECLEENNLEGMVGIATVKLELREAALKKGVSVNSILLAEKAKPDSKGERLEINKDSENLSKIYHLSSVKSQTRSLACGKIKEKKPESGTRILVKKPKALKSKTSKKAEALKRAAAAEVPIV